MCSPFRAGPRHAAAGFTLLEILVVLVILGLLASLAVNQIGRTVDHARVATAKIAVTQSFKSPLFMFNNHVGAFPTSAEGLDALVIAPAGKESRWLGPYSETVPLDPWGEPYQYASPPRHNKQGYDLWSKGPDRLSGTDDDIGNWSEAPKPSGVP